MTTTIPLCTPPTRARARCLAVLAAVVVMLIGSVAWAAPAPMCNDSAQSIAAPFPILPSRNGELRGRTPCGERVRFELGKAPTPQHELTAPPLSFMRMPAVSPRSIPRARGQRRPVSDTVRYSTRPGFAQGIFRPPRHL